MTVNIRYKNLFIYYSEHKIINSVFFSVCQKIPDINRKPKNPTQMVSKVMNSRKHADIINILTMPMNSAKIIKNKLSSQLIYFVFYILIMISQFNVFMAFMTLYCRLFTFKFNLIFISLFIWSLSFRSAFDLYIPSGEFSMFCSPDKHFKFWSQVY